MPDTQLRPTNLPHISWTDLYNDGVMREIAVINTEENGDLHFILIESLDQIDRKRLVNIVTRRHADAQPLWELLETVTLKNGMNALRYFHQLVQVRTQSGRIMKPSMNRRGIGKPIEQPQAVTEEVKKPVRKPRAKKAATK
jgi:hypothetical protein